MRVTKFIRVTNKAGRPTQVDANRQTNITMRRTDNTFQFDMPDEANLSEIYEILRPYDRRQVSLFSLLIFMFSCHLTITIWPLWAKQSDATTSPVFGPVFLFKGIFASCASPGQGQYECNNYLRPVFTLSHIEFANRTFAVMSNIMMGVTLILMLFGMECSKIYMSDDKAYRKVIIMKAASISCLIGGFMLLWLCCVYAAQIKYEYFYDQQHSVFIGSELKINSDKVRYEWGGCIYAGWVISCIEIICSAMIWLVRGFSKERKEEKQAKQVDDQNYTGFLDQLEKIQDPYVRKSLAAY